MSDEIFNEQYYKSINYTDYISRRERYVITARNMIAALQSFSLLNKSTKILDFGCALGFLVDGFLQHGYDIAGYDISKWATDFAKEQGLPIIDRLHWGFDLLIALDVFEHMTDDDIANAMHNTNTPLMIVRIPCAEINETTFHLDISRRDSTHINCKTKKQWKEYFSTFGYTTTLTLNLDTIYDSPGVFCAILLKTNYNV